MHLWPSLTIRDSFKRAYLQKLDLNLNLPRMKRSKSSPAAAPLLSDKSDGVRDEEVPTNSAGLLSFCHDFFLLLSCCCCCFCCGACGDEENNS